MRNRWSVKRITLILTIPVAVIILAVWAYNKFQAYQYEVKHGPSFSYTSYESLQPDTLKFFAHGCEGWAGSRESKLPEIRWINDKTVRIKKHMGLGCDYRIKNGNYKIHDKTLILEYGVPRVNLPPGAGYLACACSHEVSYEITNLKKADYDIQLVEVETPAAVRN